jgi:hypothetical protein
MKKLMLLFIITSYVFGFSEIKVEKFNGELWGIETDGKNIYSLVLYPKYQKLQIVYPFRAETKPLSKFKSFYRYYQLINGKIITLFDNSVFIYDTTLKLIKKIKLPKSGGDYHFNYSLNMKNTDKNHFYAVMLNGTHCFLLNDFNLMELKDELIVYGNKLEMIKNHVTINGNQTDVKYKDFYYLIHFLFVLNNEHILVRNSFFDNAGKLLATLPFTFGIRHALSFENQYVIPSTENIIIINKEGGIIKILEEETPGILGILGQDQIVLRINNHYIGILSLKTLTVRKKDLGEEIAGIVLLDGKLCYIPNNNWKILKIIPLKDIFAE